MRPSVRLVAIADLPAEAIRLLDEQEAALSDQPAGVRAWMQPGIVSLREGVRAGRVDGALSIGPKDEAVAIATWDTGPELPRRVSWYFSRGYDAAPAVEGFLRSLEASGPLLGVWEPGPGLVPEAAGPVLAAAGFVRTLRRDLVFPADVPLPPRPGPAAEGPLRPLALSDEPALARLLGRAYADNPTDRALFMMHADPVEEMRASVHALLHGGVGVWRADASFAVEAGGALAAATIVTDLNGPLVAEVMTDPGHRRHGLARRLLTESLYRLRASGAARPRLVVTEGNDRAEALYRSLGFVDDPTAVGGIWLRPSVVAQLPSFSESEGSPAARIRST